MTESVIGPTAPERHLVLIVDDLPTNLIYFNEALTIFGYRTVTAANGKEGLEKVNSIVPDLILSDVNMPEMDGYELCAAVKKNPVTQDIPIILVTAQDDRDSLVQGLEMGADDFLIKPVNLSELQARVRNLLLVKKYRDHMKRYTSELETQVTLRTAELNNAFTDLKSVNLQLKQSIMDTIQRLSTAAEYKDKDTAAHIWRMSHYSQILARAMGMSPDEVESILYASPMHDVGKIGTPDHILFKEGKLTAEEKQIMDQHTLIGERILGGSSHPLLQLAKEVAGGHHERWDGTGYPRQLIGEDIPYAARIVAVADVYDALTTKRVYKDAWTIDATIAHIQEGSGTQFDPACVATLIDNRAEIEEIQKSDQAPKE